MTRILLGVTGSAACFKAVALCSELVQSGHEVQPVLTRSASRLVTPLQFSCVAGCKALDDEWEPSDPAGMDHIVLAREADLLLVAPATADFLGQTAAGLATSERVSSRASVSDTRRLSPSLKRSSPSI